MYATTGDVDVIWKPIRRWLIGPTAVNDPVFGRLTFRRHEAPHYWTGAGNFAPLGATVEFLVEADEAGPGEAQRALYRTIEDRWDELHAAASNALIDFHREALDAELTDVRATYSLVRIVIPRRETPDMEWRMGFDSTHDPNHRYMVDFEGWDATGAVSPEG